MKLALVSPLPPLPCPAAEAALKLIPRLAAAEDVELHLFAHAPEQVAPGFAREFPVHPTADLPHLLRSGAVEVPIYIFDNNDYHYHQLRLMCEYPGIIAELTQDDTWIPQQYHRVYDHVDAVTDPSDVDMILEAARNRIVLGRPVHRPNERHWPAHRLLRPSGVETRGGAERVRIRPHRCRSCLRALDRALHGGGGFGAPDEAADDTAEAAQ